MATTPAGRTTPDLVRQHVQMLLRHLEILRSLNAPAKVIESVEQAIKESRQQLEAPHELHP